MLNLLKARLNKLARNWCSKRIAGMLIGPCKVYVFRSTVRRQAADNVDILIVRIL